MEGFAVFGRIQLVFVDRSGNVLATLSKPHAGTITSPLFSPDEKFVAVSVGKSFADLDLMVYEIESGTALNLSSTTPIPEVGPLWSPDGKTIGYSRGFFNGPYLKSADGSDTAGKLLYGSRPFLPTDWTDDGRYFIGGTVEELATTEGDISFLRIGSPDRLENLISDSELQINAIISPDGRYVAYQSSSSKKFQIMVSRFPSGQGRWQVSSDGGVTPRWSMEGNELLYVHENTLMSVSVELGETFRKIEEPKPLFNGDTNRLILSSVNLFSSWDVTKAGQKFIVVQAVDEISDPWITVVQNWTAEFKDRQ
jgi:Tol biopolymer transport system component